jgi:hypothetical protein
MKPLDIGKNDMWNLPMQEPWARVVGFEADDNIAPCTYNVTTGRVYIVGRTAV